MNPVLIVGLGGAGGKVVLGLRARLERELLCRGWGDGIPHAWQLRWVDVTTVQERYRDIADPLPDCDYLGLNQISRFADIDTRVTMQADVSGRLDRLVGWRPSPDIPAPVDLGAGQMRGVGRMIGLSQTSRLSAFLNQALETIAAGRAQLSRLSRTLGGSGEAFSKPIVIVVASVAGGFGSATCTDVCDILRALNPDLSPRIMAVLFTPELFADIGADAGIVPNSAAAVAELMSGYFSRGRTVEPLLGLPDALPQSMAAGPSIPYLIGTRNLNGEVEKLSAFDTIRAVTSTLASTLMSERLGEQFFLRQAATYHVRSGMADRGTAYSMFNVPPTPDGQGRCGVVSSFGSSTISVGARHFEAWATDRLAQSAVAKLARRTESGPSAEEVAHFIEQCGLPRANFVYDVGCDRLLNELSTDVELTRLRDITRKELEAVLYAADTSRRGHFEFDSGRFRAECETSLRVGRDLCGSAISASVSSAVSTSLADHGIALTVQLIDAAVGSLRFASSHLKQVQRELVENGSGAVPGQALRSWLTSRGAAATSERFTDSLFSWALQRRCEVALELVESVRRKVLEPLRNEIARAAPLLLDDSLRLSCTWPTDDGRVSWEYLPWRTERVLINPTGWDEDYHTLMRATAGSELTASSVVAAGGFEVGPANGRQFADRAVELGSETWWDHSGDTASISLRINPEQVRTRARQWLRSDPNSPIGAHLSMGLNEYLAGDHPDHEQRLERFEQELRLALGLAAPLIAIDRDLMARVHPGHDHLYVSLDVEPFPFPSTASAARDVVERVFESTDGQYYRDLFCSDGVDSDSVVILSVLENAVQPAVVSSLTDPINRVWNSNFRRSAAEDPSPIRGIRTYNAARVLSESIPLTAPALQTWIGGWILGRLFGLITGPDPQTGFAVRFKSDDSPDGGIQSAPLPWPVLCSFSCSDLAERRRSPEWLPAVLEHMQIAMLTLASDETSLDGYDRIFRIGENAAQFMYDWVDDGQHPTGEPELSKTKGTNYVSRREQLLADLTDNSTSYHNYFNTEISVDWSEFSRIPFGFSLREEIAQAIQELIANVPMEFPDSYKL